MEVVQRRKGKKRTTYFIGGDYENLLKSRKETSITKEKFFFKILLVMAFTAIIMICI